MNIQDNYGNTALIEAAINNHYDCFQYLVDRGADVNLKGRSGNTALITAARRDLHNYVKYLVEHGGDVNSPNDDGMTPLAACVQHSNVDGFKFLLDNHAEINIMVASQPLLANVYADSNLRNAYEEWKHLWQYRKHFIMLLYGCASELLVDESEVLSYVFDSNISKEICTFLGPWPKGLT